MRLINVINNFVLILLFFICVIIATLFLSGSLIYRTNSDTDFFFTLAEKFAENHQYINDSYTCINYTQEFGFIVNSLGYETFYYSNINEKHAYNLVAVEPQTGILRTIS